MINYPREYSCCRVSVCPSVRLSQVGVLLKRLNVGIMQAAPHDSPGTLRSFLMPKISAELK